MNLRFALFLNRSLLLLQSTDYQWERKVCDTEEQTVEHHGTIKYILFDMLRVVSVGELLRF